MTESKSTGRHRNGFSELRRHKDIVTDVLPYTVDSELLRIRVYLSRYLNVHK